MTRVFPGRNGLRRVGNSDHQRAIIESTQRAVNKCIREHYAGQPCCTCGNPHPGHAGHFRVSGAGSTRFHPWNIHLQCYGCNVEYSGKTYEHGVFIDKLHGRGAAAFLERLSRKTEPWDTRELDQLKAAARMGYQVFLQVYMELRPNHFPTSGRNASTAERRV